MIVERRRSGWSAPLVLRTTFAWALVAALLLITHWAGIAARRFPDPDDALRLVELRDLIGGQGWFDLTQHRLDAPHGGVLMHWSRLVDIPLLLVVGMLTPLVGAASAEFAALVAVPLLTLYCAMLLAARLVWRMVDLEAATLAALVMALSAPLLFQFAPLRIDHHGWQVVCALAAANALATRSAARGGVMLGLALAVWLTISLEGLPLALAFCGIAALRWLRDPKESPLLVRTLQVLAFASLALFAATRGIGDLAPHCDTLSPPFLAVLCWSALGVTLLAAQRLPLSWLLGGFALTAAGGAGILLIGAPQCTAGSFAAADPLVRQLWLSGLLEGMPFWRQQPASVLQLLVLPLFGLGAAWRLQLRSHDWLRRFWFDYLLLLLAALAMTCLVARAGAVAAALAAVPLGWQLREWLAALRGPSSLPRRSLAVTAILLAFVPTLPLLAWGDARHPEASLPPVGQASTRASACRVSTAARAIASLPRGEIAAPLDIAPALLVDTPHSLVASGHHRGSTGMRFMLDLFAADPERAHAMLIARGTRYLALCPGLAEIRLAAERMPGGLAARLQRGERPDWLEPVDTGGPLLFWKIRPD
ncbi:hypothetical protein [Qipengyuania mesophila]|uniref:hypothetical protein n=1 Tax=Qipengyuania mesophila TaxID=2867246 RepID=UPI0035174E91